MNSTPSPKFTTEYITCITLSQFEEVVEFLLSMFCSNDAKKCEGNEGKQVKVAKITPQGTPLKCYFLDIE